MAAHIQSQILHGVLFIHFNRHTYSSALDKLIYESRQRWDLFKIYIGNKQVVIYVKQKINGTAQTHRSGQQDINK